jgi:DNA-binding NarL/FixJ family response regulator
MSPQPPVTDAEERIPVVVHASDPISREGAISQLRHHPGIDLLPESGDAGKEPRVAVLLVDTLDSARLSWIRRTVRSGGLRAVLVTSAIREAELLDVIECGVGAIVWRHESTPARLVQAVISAWRGEGDLPRDLIGRLMSQVGLLRPGAPSAAGDRRTGLNAREIDVMQLIAEGLGTGEIAVKLSYSERTVKNIVQGLTTRLDLRNRAHAVAYALREGYIS